MKRPRDTKSGKWVTIQFHKENPDTTVVEEHPSPKEVAEAKRDQ